MATSSDMSSLGMSDSSSAAMAAPAAEVNGSFSEQASSISSAAGVPVPQDYPSDLSPAESQRVTRRQQTREERGRQSPGDSRERKGGLGSSQPPIGPRATSSPSSAMYVVAEVQKLEDQIAQYDVNFIRRQASPQHVVIDVRELEAYAQSLRMRIEQFVRMTQANATAAQMQAAAQTQSSAGI